MSEVCKHHWFYVNEREDTLGITYTYQCWKCQIQILTHEFKDWLLRDIKSEGKKDEKKGY